MRLSILLYQKSITSFGGDSKKRNQWHGTHGIAYANQKCEG